LSFNTRQRALYANGREHRAAINLGDYGASVAARSHFDPSKPTSLLYTKTADGGYKLVGAMYTDRVGATEDELNALIPLSIARWHQHVYFCKAPAGRKDEQRHDNMDHAAMPGMNMPQK
jgi:hypothetical protein